MKARPDRIAFYDFDGTLVSSNVVTRYAYFARRVKPSLYSLWRMLRLVSSVPAYLLLDRISRRLFNEVFFREYRGMEERWLKSQAEGLFDFAILPSIYSGAREFVRADQEQGYRTILVTGEIDSSLAPVMSYFGFDGLVANSLVFEGGVATGEVTRPLIAEETKVTAMQRMCERHHADLREAKAYSDSYSDVPMLEAAGFPCAINPDRRLRSVAQSRGWPIRSLWRAGAGGK